MSKNMHGQTKRNFAKFDAIESCYEYCFNHHRIYIVVKTLAILQTGIVPV